MILSKEERKKVVEKMEKLMSHVGDGAVNVNEMSIANKKLKELIDQYGVTIEEIKSLKKTDKMIIMNEVETYNAHPKRWIGYVASILSEFYECECLHMKSKYCFVGFDLDCQAAAEMFDRLYTHISRTSRINATKNRIDYSFGVAKSLSERLKEIKLSMMKESDMNTLVVVKKDSVDLEFKRLFPNTRKSHRANYNFSSDYMNGREYGKTMEIFKSVKE